LNLNFNQTENYDKGKLILLIEANVEKVAELPLHFSNAVFLAFQLVFIFCFVYYYVGWSCLPAIFLIILITFLHYQISRKKFEIFDELAIHRQRRINLTNDAFSGILQIKTSSMENFFIEKLLAVRSEERKHSERAQQYELLENFLY